MSRRIIQFGTSRFLQAHVDLFVHEARVAGQDIGPITVVKTTAGADRVGRLEGLRQPRGFPIRLRGYREGLAVDETIRVRSVDGTLSAVDDWPATLRLFSGDPDIVVSNVGDRGYELAEEDGGYDRSSKFAPASFPAKLLALLLARHEASAAPMLLLPCELMHSNGQTLRGQLIKVAAAWRISDPFFKWLDESIIFADTLVDRIVSEEIVPAGAIAEPYALWVIREKGFRVPLTHPSIVATDDLEPYERLKLHILNLGHTLLAEKWLREVRPETETVREMLSDAKVRGYLLEVYADEIVPGFARAGMGARASRYVDVTIGRFRNLFLNHRMSEIAQNQATKVDRRAREFIAWVGEKDPTLPLPRLSALAAAYAEVTPPVS